LQHFGILNEKLSHKQASKQASIKRLCSEGIGNYTIQKGLSCIFCVPNLWTDGPCRSRPQNQKMKTEKKGAKICKMMMMLLLLMLLLMMRPHKLLTHDFPDDSRSSPAIKHEVECDLIKLSSNNAGRIIMC